MPFTVTVLGSEDSSRLHIFQYLCGNIGRNLEAKSLFDSQLDSGELNIQLNSDRVKHDVQYRHPRDENQRQNYCNESDLILFCVTPQQLKLLNEASEQEQEQSFSEMTSSLPELSSDKKLLIVVRAADEDEVKDMSNDIESDLEIFQEKLSGKNNLSLHPKKYIYVTGDEHFGAIIDIKRTIFYMIQDEKVETQRMMQDEKVKTQQRLGSAAACSLFCVGAAGAGLTVFLAETAAATAASAVFLSTALAITAGVTGGVSLILLLAAAYFWLSRPEPMFADYDFLPEDNGTRQLTQ